MPKLDFNRVLFWVFVLVLVGVTIAQVLHKQFALVIVSLGLVVAALMPELKGLK